MNDRRIFMLAGEPSGDALGQSLMIALSRLRPGISVSGVGGPAMREAGLQSLYPYEELSVMGIAEVTSRLPNLLRRLRQTTRAVLAGNYDALVTIDSPDFSLRVSRRIRQSGRSVKTIHYVAPTIWAWRPRRAVRIRQAVDHVLALFPFEPEHLEKAGISATFVGHPVTSRPPVVAECVAKLRHQFGLGGDRILVVLPGSRLSETSRMVPVFTEVAKLVSAEHDNLRVVVVAAREVAASIMATCHLWPEGTVLLDPRPFPPHEAEEQKQALFAGADLALAASGTVTLELAMAGTPMVVAYDVHWITRLIVSRLLLVDTVTLVNLIVGHNAIPEFLGNACRPGCIADELNSLLADWRQRQSQIAVLQQAMSQLGRGGEDPGLRAARVVLNQID